MIWADRVGLGVWLIAIIAIALLFAGGIITPTRSVGLAGKAIREATPVDYDPWVSIQNSSTYIFRIQTPDKTSYQVEAPNENTAIAALRTVYLQEHPAVPHEAWELDPVVGATVRKSTNFFDKFDPAIDVKKPGLFDDLIPARQLGPWVEYQQLNASATRLMTQSAASNAWSVVWRLTVFGVLPLWLVLRIVDFIIDSARRRRKYATRQA